MSLSNLFIDMPTFNPKDINLEDIHFSDDSNSKSTEDEFITTTVGIRLVAMKKRREETVSDPQVWEVDDVDFMPDFAIISLPLASQSDNSEEKQDDDEEDDDDIEYGTHNGPHSDSGDDEVGDVAEGASITARHAAHSEQRKKTRQDKMKQTPDVDIII
ncbi:hypothetical protein E3N88_16430 [Mikania micrantha]|uniref:Uncharacterized protein n=1 Tax=Mikania micrantha TaxID=192012 RepID=A0A5N6NYA7_9ASTR|nr:hypothetical protein E3N88_16430 [Mikania micrantha]